MFIHGTQPIWPSSFMVHGWCDCVKSWYGAGATSFIHGAALMSFGMRLVWFCTVYTIAVLRSRDVYPGSWFLSIPDPGSQIPDPKQQQKRRVKTKYFSYLFLVATNITKLKKFYFWTGEEKNLGQFTKNYQNWSHLVIRRQISKSTKVTLWDWCDSLNLP